MMIHKITPSVHYNLWLKRLDTQLNEPTNQSPQNLQSSSKQKNKKSSLKTLGPSEIYNSMSPPSLVIFENATPVLFMTFIHFSSL